MYVIKIDKKQKPLYIGKLFSKVDEQNNILVKIKFNLIIIVHKKLLLCNKNNLSCYHYFSKKKN